MPNGYVIDQGDVWYEDRGGRTRVCDGSARLAVAYDGEDLFGYGEAEGLRRRVSKAEKSIGGTMAGNDRYEVVDFPVTPGTVAIVNGIIANGHKVVDLKRDLEALGEAPAPNYPTGLPPLVDASLFEREDAGSRGGIVGEGNTWGRATTVAFLDELPHAGASTQALAERSMAGAREGWFGREGEEAGRSTGIVVDGRPSTLIAGLHAGDPRRAARDAVRGVEVSDEDGNPFGGTYRRLSTLADRVVVTAIEVDGDDVTGWGTGGRPDEGRPTAIRGKPGERFMGVATIAMELSDGEGPAERRGELRAGATFAGRFDGKGGPVVERLDAKVDRSMAREALEAGTAGPGAAAGGIGEGAGDVAFAPPASAATSDGSLRLRVTREELRDGSGPVGATVRLLAEATRQPEFDVGFKRTGVVLHGPEGIASLREGFGEGTWRSLFLDAARTASLVAGLSPDDRRTVERGFAEGGTRGRGKGAPGAKASREGAARGGDGAGGPGR